MRILSLALLTGIVLVLPQTACSGANSASHKQLAQMSKDIARIHADNERLGERLTNLEMAAARRGVADKPSSQRPDLDVVRLTPEEADAPEAAEEVPDDEPRTVIRAEGSQMPTVREGSLRDETRSAERTYEAALELVKKKRYDDALEAFAGFLVRFPGHANANNAMYWRGECYYAKGDYVRAAEAFEGLIARFPKGNKVPDALLKLGLSQQRMGQLDKAKRTFQRLREAHPSSDAASKIPRE